MVQKWIIPGLCLLSLLAASCSSDKKEALALPGPTSTVALDMAKQKSDWKKLPESLEFHFIRQDAPYPIHIPILLSGDNIQISRKQEEQAGGEVKGCHADGKCLFYPKHWQLTGVEKIELILHNKENSEEKKIVLIIHISPEEIKEQDYQNYQVEAGHKIEFSVFPLLDHKMSKLTFDYEQKYKNGELTCEEKLSELHCSFQASWKGEGVEEMVIKAKNENKAYEYAMNIKMLTLPPVDINHNGIPDQFEKAPEVTTILPHMTLEEIESFQLSFLFEGDKGKKLLISEKNKKENENKALEYTLNSLALLERVSASAKNEKAFVAPHPFPIKIISPFRKAFFLSEEEKKKFSDIHFEGRLHFTIDKHYIVEEIGQIEVEFGFFSMTEKKFLPLKELKLDKEVLRDENGLTTIQFHTNIKERISDRETIAFIKARFEHEIYFGLRVKDFSYQTTAGKKFHYLDQETLTRKDYRKMTIATPEKTIEMYVSKKVLIPLAMRHLGLEIEKGSNLSPYFRIQRLTIGDMSLSSENVVVNNDLSDLSFFKGKCHWASNKDILAGQEKEQSDIYIGHVCQDDFRKIVGRTKKSEMNRVTSFSLDDLHYDKPLFFQVFSRKYSHSVNEIKSRISGTFFIETTSEGPSDRPGRTSRIRTPVSCDYVTHQLSSEITEGSPLDESFFGKGEIVLRNKSYRVSQLVKNQREIFDEQGRKGYEFSVVIPKNILEEDRKIIINLASESVVKEVSVGWQYWLGCDRSDYELTADSFKNVLDKRNFMQQYTEYKNYDIKSVHF
jgi:hypothetical protein